MQKGGGVLGGGEPDEEAEADAFADAFCYEGPADGGGARVDGLVDQSGGPPEVGEVADGDVLWVGALGVEFWYLGRGRMMRVEVGVAEIAVGEGIGAILEPDDDGVDLADDADEWVVDVVVDGVGGEDEAVA